MSSHYKLLREPHAYGALRLFSSVTYGVLMRGGVIQQTHFAHGWGAASTLAHSAERGSPGTEAQPPPAMKSPLGRSEEARRGQAVVVLSDDLDRRTLFHFCFAVASARSRKPFIVGQVTARLPSFDGCVPSGTKRS